MKKAVFAVGAALLSGSVMATGAFDGPYVQLGIGGASTETQTTYPSVLNNLAGFNTNANSTGGSFVGQILGGYSQSFDIFNIAANVFYNIGNQDSGSNSYNLTGSNGYLNANQSFKLKNTWGVSIEPGLYVTEKTLGYLKLSYFNSQLNYNASYGARVISPSYSESGSYNSSSSVNGIGYGIGAKQMFTDNIYGFVEYQYVQYDKWNDSGLFGSGYSTSYKPNQNYGWVGVGYKF